MILGRMRSSRRSLVVLLVGVASSPLGHILAYEARYGPTAGRVQSTGVHAYFPALAGTLAAGLGAALIVSLSVLALARLVAGRRKGLQAGPRFPFMRVLPIVFTIQLATFAVQEGAEALATGASMPSFADLVLWGGLGMLPVAALAAFVLSWLWIHLEAAVRQLRSAARSFRPRPSGSLLRRVDTPPSDPLCSAALGGFAKRGPPRLLT